MKKQEITTRNKENIKNGKEFEKYVRQVLYEHGFWVREDFGSRGGQCLDIFCARNNIFYIFECKHCKNSYFDTRRITDNQKLTKIRMNETNNTNIYYVYHNKETGETTISKDILTDITQAENFIDFINNLN